MLEYVTISRRRQTARIVPDKEAKDENRASAMNFKVKQPFAARL
jgi:hypothetical protein